jgi:hypothetical protein
MENITPLGLHMLLATYLNGLNFFENLLIKVNLKKGADGKVKPYIVDNVKVTLKVVMKEMYVRDPGSPYIAKYKSALKELLPYGSKIMSTKIEGFLIEFEKNSDSVIHTLDKSESGFSLLISLDDEEKSPEDYLRMTSVFEIAINQIQQVHS